MKATLNDFGIKFKQMPLLCDNESAVKLTNNLVQHSRTKNIDVRHHFIRDHQQKEDIWECGHRRSTYRYFHQATWRKKILQAKEWIEHTWLLQYVMMHPHLYDMPLLRVIQGKSWLAWHTYLLRTCLVHLDIFHIWIGSFMKIKWIWCLYGTIIVCMLEMI